MPALKPATIGQKFLTDCGQNRPLTTIILIAAIVSPLSIIIGGVIGAAMIIAGIILRKKNTNSKG